MTRFDTDDDGRLVNSDGDPLKWGEPLNARRFHIFDSGRALCGGWMLFPDEDVEADDDFTDGQDCKSCCRKAGLID